MIVAVCFRRGLGSSVGSIGFRVLDAVVSALHGRKAGSLYFAVKLRHVETLNRKVAVKWSRRAREYLAGGCLPLNPVSATAVTSLGARKCDTVKPKVRPPNRAGISCTGKGVSVR